VGARLSGVSLVEAPLGGLALMDAPLGGLSLLDSPDPPDPPDPPETPEPGSGLLLLGGAALLWAVSWLRRS
jgi:hypothetical protein